MYFPVVRLGGIFKITSGGTPSRKNKDFYENGEIPWIKTGELKQRYINSATEYITNEGLAKSSAKLFPKRTVLVAMYGATIGSCSILDIEAATNQACAAFLPHDEVHPEYLYYFFGSIKNELIELGVGGAQPNISASILRNVEMPFPSLEIQKKIADILDCAQGLIDKRNEQIEILDEFLQSVFFEIIGDPLTNPYEWDAKPLSELAEITMGQSPRGTSYNEDGFGVPLLNGPTEFGERHPVEKQWTTEPTRLCEENDILFCVRGATAGRLNYADKEYCIGRGLASIRPYNIDHTSLVYAVLEHLYDHFQDTSDGSTFANINRGRIGEVTIPIVDSERLSKFIDISRQTDRQKELMKKGLIEMENNFNSLMQRAFRGELFS
jgi:type I restriction enzyme S subunit